MQFLFFLSIVNSNIIPLYAGCKTDGTNEKSTIKFCLQESSVFEKHLGTVF